MKRFFKGNKAMGSIFNDNINFVNRSAGNFRPQESSREMLLSVNTGGAGPLPLTGNPLNSPINVVSTSIDTRRFKRSTNLLIFTTLISLPAGAVVQLHFDITRSVDGGGSTQIGSTYTFEATANTAFSQSFAFQFADGDLEGGSYTYSVQLSPNSTISGTGGTTISNATLTVFAVRS